MASDSFGAQKRLPGKRFRSGVLGDALSEMYKDVESGFVASELNGIFVLQQVIVDAATADYDQLAPEDCVVIDVVVIKETLAGGAACAVAVATDANALIHTALDMNAAAGAVRRMLAGYDVANAAFSSGDTIRTKVTQGDNGAVRVLITCRRT